MTFLRIRGLEKTYPDGTRAVKGFDLGKFGFLDVLDAQRTLLAAKGQYLRALGETHRARIELDRLLGASEQTPPAERPAQP